MDWVTSYGLVAVAAMVVFYALEARHHLFTLAFAGACVLASVYGFLAGTWPFGAVEAVWAAVALWRWNQRRSRVGNVAADRENPEWTKADFVKAKRGRNVLRKQVLDEIIRQRDEQSRDG